MSDRGSARLVVNVATPAETVWAQVRRFGEVARWNHFLLGSRIVEGNSGGVGAVREVITKDGKRVREKLLELDDDGRAIGYQMLTFPIPVTGQRNRIVVSPGDNELCSVVTFSAEFEPEPGTAAADVTYMNPDAFSAAAESIGIRFGVDTLISYVERYGGDDETRITGSIMQSAICQY